MRSVENYKPSTPHTYMYQGVGKAGLRMCVRERKVQTQAVWHVSKLCSAPVLIKKRYEAKKGTNNVGYSLSKSQNAGWPVCLCIQGKGRVVSCNETQISAWTQCGCVFLLSVCPLVCLFICVPVFFYEVSKAHVRKGDNMAPPSPERSHTGR